MLRGSYGEEGFGKPLKGFNSNYENKDVFRASALELHKNLMNNNNLLIGVSGIFN
jgi:hypothetical protein